MLNESHPTMVDPPLGYAEIATLVGVEPKTVGSWKNHLPGPDLVVHGRATWLQSTIVGWVVPRILRSFDSHYREPVRAWAFAVAPYIGLVEPTTGAVISCPRCRATTIAPVYAKRMPRPPVKLHCAACGACWPSRDPVAWGRPRRERMLAAMSSPPLAHP